MKKYEISDIAHLEEIKEGRSSKLSKGARKSKVKQNAADEESSKYVKKKNDTKIEQEAAKKSSELGDKQEDEMKNEAAKDQVEEMKKVPLRPSKPEEIDENGYLDVGDLFTEKCNYDRIRVPKQDIVDLCRQGLVTVNLYYKTCKIIMNKILGSYTTDRIVDAGLVLLKRKLNREDVIFYLPSFISIIGTPGNPI